MPEVICIPTTNPKQKTIRVAAYCRVSSLPQEESYESQVEHFTTTISTHPDWTLVKVYGDEGVTGLNTIKRKGFKQMIKDGKAGKFDLLLVKSISRLGRNTVDLLSSVRELRSAGVTCFFEKENIQTDASAGELMITLLSAFAQMESESISQNVRFIFDAFLSGQSLQHITNELIRRKYPTGKGTLAWCKQSVRRILQNRKYCGDVILQVTVTDDLITKHRSMNTGQAAQYIVLDGIPAIISRQTFFLAQGEMERRGRMKFDSDVSTYKNGFTGKLVCTCGAHYNRVNTRKWYSWKCYDRIRGNCKSPIIPESDLEDATLRAASRPEKYSSSLLDLVESVTYDKTFDFTFHTGISISVKRIITSPSPTIVTELMESEEVYSTPFHVSGEPRKRLAQRLGVLTGNKVVYTGFPSCTFEVGKYTITQDGTVEGRLSKAVLKGLARSGFTPSQE